MMLAVSRAIGETMIVVMAAGATANLTVNPFKAMTTVTFQIVAMLTGEGSFDHPATFRLRAGHGPVPGHAGAQLHRCASSSATASL
jgi:ABC-type phosphate transport system permease subunit